MSATRNWSEMSAGGLEVVPATLRDGPGLGRSFAPEAVPVASGLQETQRGINSSIAKYESSATGAPWTSRRRSYVVAAICVAALVVVGAVLGGVLPKVLSSKSGSAATQNPPNASRTATVSVLVPFTNGPSATATQGSSPSPSPTLGPGGVTVECPRADNTTYTVPATSQVYIRQCGTNWGARDGAVDIQSATKNNMEDCIALCAKYNANFQTTKRSCVGVTWVYVGPQGTAVNYCWAKSSLGLVTYYDDMESAVLL